MKLSDMTPQKLLPDLRESVSDDRRWVHSPFLISLIDPDSVDVATEHNALLNLQFVAAQERYHRLIEQGRYQSAIFATTRPYRTLVLDELSVDMTPQQYWEAVGAVWVDQENPSDFTQEWRKRFTRELPHKEHLMEEDEREAFLELPDTLVVYRAGYDWQPPAQGLAWTLDQSVAQWFARRYKADRPIYAATILKQYTVALILRRNEKEIIVADPTALRSITHLGRGG